MKSVEHGWQPCSRERQHALLPSQAYEMRPLSGLVRSYGMYTRIQQREPGDPLRLAAHDFERHPTAHRVTRHCESIRRAGENPGSHRLHGAQAVERDGMNGGNGLNRLGHFAPDFLIREQAA
jgi:hypothetical protein